MDLDPIGILLQHFQISYPVKQSPENNAHIFSYKSLVWNSPLYFCLTDSPVVKLHAPNNTP